ncbi:unnamed protein product [Boreogadus saida]
MITSESGSIYPTTDILHQAGPSARLLHQAGPPSAPPPGRASIGSSTRQGLQPGSSTRQELQHGSSISSFSTAPLSARLHHQLLQPWIPEDHSHWRSLIHQPQTTELSRSSGGRGSDELRRRDQQDVRIRWGSAQSDVILQIHGSPISSPPLQKHVLSSSSISISSPSALHQLSISSPSALHQLSISSPQTESCILGEVAVSVMITSESGSIEPTTDILHQAGPPARLLHQAGPPSAPPPGRAFTAAPPSAPSAMDSWASVSSSTRQGLQHGSSTRQGLQCGSSISSFSHGFLVWPLVSSLSLRSILAPQASGPKPLSLTFQLQQQV